MTHPAAEEWDNNETQQKWLYLESRERRIPEDRPCDECGDIVAVGYIHNHCRERYMYENFPAQTGQEMNYQSRQEIQELYGESPFTVNLPPNPSVGDWNVITFDGNGRMIELSRGNLLDDVERKNKGETKGMPKTWQTLNKGKKDWWL